MDPMSLSDALADPNKFVESMAVQQSFSLFLPNVSAEEAVSLYGHFPGVRRAWDYTLCGVPGCVVECATECARDAVRAGADRREFGENGGG